ncbi:30S ribosomal protein S19e [Candidatus Woesearchaeota archaeon]|nr:30S ribosomal protein S19e [Candidatus Woesearchaeota archaeon]
MQSTPRGQLIITVAKTLQDIIQRPEWADYVKTGTHKQQPPIKEDWWYLRAAGILNTVYSRGPIGVSKLRTKYGGLKERGVKPSIFAKGSGSVARHLLQQLEQAGLIKQAERGVHKGRVITPKGASLLYQAAKQAGVRQPAPRKPARKRAKKKA